MDSCIEYLAYSPVGEAEVRVAFADTFEARPVVWCATIRCLPEDSDNQQQYIEVQVDDPLHPTVRVGLPLPMINEPVILKTIKMIRQYKNLRRGRHEFLGSQKNH
jgi:hypothetical protein